MVTTALQNTAKSTRIASVSAEHSPKSISTLSVQKQRDTAQYIAEMILELRNMAKSSRLFKVMVPLEYAYYEAFSVANQVEVPPGEAERIRELSKASGGDADHTMEDY